MCLDSRHNAAGAPGVPHDLYFAIRNVERLMHAILTSLAYEFSMFRIPTVISIYEILRTGESGTSRCSFRLHS
jgi:hypothetical protein